jgi:hypothetical protein
MGRLKSEPNRSTSVLQSNASTATIKKQPLVQRCSCIMLPATTLLAKVPPVPIPTQIVRYIAKLQALVNAHELPSFAIDYPLLYIRTSHSSGSWLPLCCIWNSGAEEQYCRRDERI